MFQLNMTAFIPSFGKSVVIHPFRGRILSFPAVKQLWINASHPKYSKAKQKEIIFTNQDCVVKDHKFLKFPKTKQRLNIGKLGAAEGKLKQVRVIPKYGQYVVELVMDVPMEPYPHTDNDRYMSIDLGIDNFAAVITNTGRRPLLLKGKHIKSINQYYNKMKAYYISVLRQGKKPKEGPFTSKRLERLYQKRHHKLKDLFHKASRKMVDAAVQEKVSTIAIGFNEQWKQESDMGKQTNQSFTSIPHRMLVEMLAYKAAEKGIKVILQEESYTSKASFLDHDDLPAYGEKDIKLLFSGTRVKRGLYRSKNGVFINADVNGACNILRKVFPNACANGIEGLDGDQSINVSTPLSLIVR